MKKYKAAIFDVDGTLLNTKEGILSSVFATIEEFGLRPLREDEIHLFIGPPIQRSMMQVYGYTKEQAQEFANVFRARYSQHEHLFKAEVYDGIHELFDKLKAEGVRIAIATYKREDYAIDIVDHFGLHEKADVTHGADNFNKLTKADIIELCINDMGVTKEECVMVGDSDNDAIGARDLGCDFIGVTYGFGFNKRADVEEFDNVGIAETPLEIFDFV